MKVTIKDIARLAGVSTATVSKVVNGKDERISEATRQRVLKVIEEQHYVPNRVASSMVTKQTKTLGLVIPDIANPFFPELARGAEDYAQEAGYTLILCNSDNELDKEDTYIAMLQEKMVDGLIFTASSRRTEVSSALSRVRIPVITVDRQIEGLSAQSKIVVDNDRGAFKAVDHLIRRGYRKIFHLAGPMTSRPAKQRYAGYLQAHERHALLPPEGHLLEGEYVPSWGVAAVERLIADGKDFDAVFCDNDLIAIGAMKTLIRAGYRVPEDVGVVGYDDIYLAALVNPGLTTVRQPIYEMGNSAARQLIAMIEDNPKESQEITLATELVVRESTR